MKSVSSNTSTKERLTLSVPDAAAIVGIGRSTLYELIRIGEVRGVRLGRRIVVPIAVVEEILRGTANTIAK